jgi:hypothetical protein
MVVVVPFLLSRLLLSPPLLRGRSVRAVVVVALINIIIISSKILSLSLFFSFVLKLN